MPKNLIRLFWGWVFPYITLHTAYIGEYLHFRYLKCLVKLLVVVMSDEFIIPCMKNRCVIHRKILFQAMIFGCGVIKGFWLVLAQGGRWHLKLSTRKHMGLL